MHPMKPPTELETGVQALRILLVEDSSVHQLLTTKMLEKTGLVDSIQIATSLQTARDVLDVGEVNLVLLDLGLPDSEGLATFVAIREYAPYVPVIVLSASAEENTALQTIQRGGQDYLVKGRFDVELLSHVVRYACERHRSEEALRTSELTTRAIFESSLDAMVILDDEGRILDCNPAMSELSGFPKAELLSKHINKLPADEMEFLQHWDEMRSKGVCKGQFAMMNAAGETRHVDFVARGHFLTQRHCVVLRDVTEKLAKESQLRQALKMETVGHLAGGVAHDFNNLLMVISSYAELLTTRLQSDHKCRHYIEQIVGAAERGASLTQQLLAFSKKQIIRPEIVNVNEVMARTVEIIKRLIGSDIRVAAKATKVIPRIRIDRVQLEQIFINLCLNARDAMPQGGDLTIRNEVVDLDVKMAEDMRVAPGSYVRVQVSDTGVGMNEAVKSRIFEPFFTTKIDGKGTGLGLATVYGIVQQSEGAIQVHTAEGKGTTFDIYLPRIFETDNADSHELKQNSPGGKETILLVEDESSIRKVAAEFLSSKGYRVIEAENGAAGLNVARSNGGAIRCVVTDVVMPGMRGTQMAQQINAVYPDTRFIFMSGYEDRFRNFEAVESITGAAFLQKPFSLELLGSTVRSVLDGTNVPSAPPR